MGNCVEFRVDSAMIGWVARCMGEGGGDTRDSSHLCYGSRVHLLVHVVLVHLRIHSPSKQGEKKKGRGGATCRGNNPIPNAPPLTCMRIERVLFRVSTSVLHPAAAKTHCSTRGRKKSEAAKHENDTGLSKPLRTFFCSVLGSAVVEFPHL